MYENGISPMRFMFLALTTIILHKYPTKKRNSYKNKYFNKNSCILTNKIQISLSVDYGWTWLCVSNDL